VTYRTHMAFGAASAAVLVGPVHDMLGGPPLPHPAITVPAALLLGSLAGLAPDLDEPNAALARGSWTPQTAPKLFKFLVSLFSLLFFRPLGLLLRGVLGHRGGTHSLLCATCATLLVGSTVNIFLGPQYDWVTLSFLFGYLSHIFADSLNPSGVPLFWPFQSKKKRWHSLPKALRVPTTTPPTMREQLIAAVMVGVIPVILVLSL